MNKHQDIIWNYLDGSCSPEEQASVEASIASDESFRILFLQSKALHEQLQQSSVEMPSMSFTRNVMDKLPAVRNVATSPLVSKRWMRTFVGSLLSFLAFLASSSFFVSAPASTNSPEIEHFFDPFFALFHQIPINVLMMCGIIGISLMVLLSLDKWLQTRFQG